MSSNGLLLLLFFCMISHLYWCTKVVMTALHVIMLLCSCALSEIEDN